MHEWGPMDVLAYAIAGSAVAAAAAAARYAYLCKTFCELLRQSLYNNFQ